jgi:quinol monooxygenase YgiN
MLLASISFRLMPHKRDEALSAVDALVQRMRGAPGCARGRVLSDSEDQNLFVITSE